MRRRLAAAASATGKQVRDTLNYASGAPAEFETYALRGIRAVVGLGNAAFELNGTIFNLQGDADTLERYNWARRDVANFPRGMRPGKVNIRAPLARPFIWQAVRAGNILTLRGSTPDEATKAEIERQARQAGPGVSVVSQMQIARGAPDLNFAIAAGVGLRQLALLSEGDGDAYRRRLERLG